jgi:hypothetical protein
MQVAVIHRIKDPDAFYSKIGEAMKDGPPAGLELPVQARATDNRTHICFWEAPSVDAVRDTVEPLVGDLADNEFIEAEYMGVGTAERLAPYRGSRQDRSCCAGRPSSARTR